MRAWIPINAMRTLSVYNKSALSQYQKINTQTGVVDADPHRLIQLLLDGALDRIAQAKGALATGDAATMGEALGKAVGIISGHQIFQLKPVEVVAWDDTYAAKEYGVTAAEMDTFVARADAEVSRKEKRGTYARFKGKFDPKSLT